MPRNPPRYDLPNAAPEQLRLVQAFVNTVNFENGDDWLAGWLEEHGVHASDAELARAGRLREALRELLYANSGHLVEGSPWRVLDDAADAAALSVDFARPALVPRATGLEGSLGSVLAVAYTAMADGSWQRLKACKNSGCCWAFYDYSKNRSGSWCSMQLCGNRMKVREYRRRQTERATSA
jgi:predicted RNA-binding Zn ribbon-like protein